MLTGASSRELAEYINQRQPVRLHATSPRIPPGRCWRGVVRTGHAGAQAMIEETLSLAPDARLEMVDVVEAGDRVAVRWCLTGTRTNGPVEVAMIAIYRFADGRIAEDWGVWSAKPWQPPDGGPQLTSL